MLTVTASSYVTVISIAVPAPYVPSALVEVTFVTLGAVVSITSALLSARAFPPEVGAVRPALFPAASLIVPLLRAIGDELFKSIALSSAPTVYWNVSVVVPVPLV